MVKHLIPLLCVMLLCILFVVFSSTISKPIDFLVNTLSFPRMVLHSSVYAQGKLTREDTLLIENKKLSEELVKMESLKKDNDALRSQFQETTYLSTNLLPAKVVGFTGALNNPNALILDQGEKNHVKSGMAVIVGVNLVGKIGKTTSWSSELILPVSKKFSTLGVSASHNSPGIVKGEEDFIMFENVVITDSISKNEMVITKGEKSLGGIGIPPDLIIGKIMLVNKSETQPFQNAQIKSLIDFKKLTTVFIITK
ncbi:MAG: rod shape-determining protein MreC [Candidatus Levybacteria bacterium]|nr:rod shape-determining protein MreC [Candidatus Levybacteria bacterium]MBP9815004.1 rod shape-determining protein MreC [Candidatus Levybacteria bacterium]